MLEALLGIALLLSTALSLFLVTLPSRYIAQKNVKETSKQTRPKTSVQVVVLGDIGRSPRMEYHALSIAKNGGLVDLIGVLDSDVHPQILQEPLINIVPISQSPSFLQTNNTLLVLFFAPLKALWQAFSLYYVLGYKCEPAQWMLLQNPPFIPTFTIASFVAFVRGSRLVLDWHNFGYSLFALKFGPSHPFVRLHRWYEFKGPKSAYAHFTVTNVMAKYLQSEADITAHPLHDRPPMHFQPLSPEQKAGFLSKFDITSKIAIGKSSNTRILVSSTSWTPDEDFSILLDALVAYSSRAKADSSLPSIIAIITGKGPQKEHYLSKIAELKKTDKLNRVEIHTAWLSIEDYALLLGSADLGVSLHMSSSGLDLPMKVVDMFGTGLPVVGWSDFEAWSELVQEGVNGKGFQDAQGLEKLLVGLFSDDGRQLEKLKAGAMKECDRRWDNEWNSVAGRVFGVVD
ncbi:putative beta-1,4-mannosyltransferase [Microthyrium microscopicum]|uniref:Chitobiosyldiphosphodolichol beta-mannosyltransferase n=1 Tax=Microthyrium microscopicum TaxID=703497 RepID=A0A6A6UHQ5_9PEZI|nr:putative beta-1,4-mannosyltransferase [Microthyrium microscopicum]